MYTTIPTVTVINNLFLVPRSNNNYISVFAKVDSGPGPSKKQKVSRKFPQAWKTKFRSWLRYDEGRNLMFCTLCEKHCKVGPWVNGTDNFRLKTLETRVRSNEHKAALPAEAPGQQVLPATLTAAQHHRNGSIIAALRTVYWIVTEEITNREYASLLQFQRLQGCVDVQNLRIGGNASYDTPDIFNQLLAALNEIVDEQIDSKLQASPCIGIGIDESTERSNAKHIVAVARYIDLENGSVSTTFLKCKQVEDGHASGIYNNMKAILNEKRIPMRKVGGLGTDGASVMTGHLNGVTMLMRTDNPHCISVQAKSCSQPGLQKYSINGKPYQHHQRNLQSYLLVSTEVRAFERFK